LYLLKAEARRCALGENGLLLDGARRLGAGFREMHLPSSERYLERPEGKPFGLPRRRAAAELYLALLAESLFGVSAPGGVTISLTRGRFAA
jgi:hypothetical protein